jgi:hypothetical protein
MAYASTTDVQVSLGRPLAEDEQTQATGLLDRVETRIRARIPTLHDRLADESDLVALLVEVEADAVARVIRNPNAYLQEQDGDYMYTRDRSMATGSLHLTDDEWARLGVSKAAFTIGLSLGRTFDEEPSSLEEGPVWVDVYP